MEANTYIIACATIKPELLHAKEVTGLDYPIIWCGAGLHDTPNLLSEAMKKSVKRAEEKGAERILMSFGFCGNSVEGLCSEKCEIILPKVDDCITLLLGREKRAKLQEKGPVYFITKGWLKNKGVLYNQYVDIMDRYGEEMGEEIFEMMAGSYKYHAILDTHCYEMEDVIKETSRMAEEMGMENFVADASDQYLQELLTGPWPEEKFVRVAAGQAIDRKMLF